jgi:tight adherence protein C
MNTTQLSPTQQMILTVGISVAVTIYLIYKAFGWWRARRGAAVKRRSEQAKAVPPVSSRMPDDISPDPELAHTADGGPVTASSRPSPISINWPLERKPEVQRNLFEDVGAEYPYADGSDRTFGSATPVMAELLPSSGDARRTMFRQLRQAGYYQPHAAENLAAIRYAGIMIPIIFFGALLVVVPESLETIMIGGLAIGPMLGWALPALYVRSRATARAREIELALPDMLDLMNMCVSQGMTVPAAMARVGNDIETVYPALSKELKIVTEQTRVGSVEQALTNLSDRIDAPDVKSFASLLIQTEQMGTSISDALASYSDSMRETMRQRADQKANSASFKLLFPTVLCLMPAVFLFLMGPSMIELNRFFVSGGIQGLNNQQQLPNQQFQRSAQPR